jgi:hypothetical protein
MNRETVPKGWKVGVAEVNAGRPASGRGFHNERGATAGAVVL